MQPDGFVKAYEQALASQDWERVGPLMHEDVCVTFSDGRVFRGKAAVKGAFEANFEAIQGEQYRVLNIHWARQEDGFAVYLFDFEWSGLMGGKPVAGAGRGTSILVYEDGRWRLLIEHLGPMPRG